MISYIRGDVLFRNESSVVIDVNGIGYEVFVPYNVLCTLERTGGQVELYTYLQVKEDGIALFGFATRQDLNTFKLLITVNGIGPKGALGLMSYMTTKDLILAVLADDAKAISKAPGIGAKTAGKLILELKDKFKLEDTLGTGTDFGFAGDTANTAAASAGVSESDEFAAMKSEAVQALTALGYSSSEALKAIRSVPEEEGMTVEKLLKLGLKYL